jgi:hypothetical protein
MLRGSSVNLVTSSRARLLRTNPDRIHRRAIPQHPELLDNNRPAVRGEYIIIEPPKTADRHAEGRLVSASLRWLPQ